MSALEFETHPLIHEILDFIREGGDRSICTPREVRSASRRDNLSCGRSRIAIVAGEASGDQLGSEPRAGSRPAGIAYEAIGVGGAALAAEGLKQLFRPNGYRGDGAWPGDPRAAAADPAYPADSIGNDRGEAGYPCHHRRAGFLQACGEARARGGA